MPKSIFYQVGGLLTDLLSWEEQVYLLGNSTAAFLCIDLQCILCQLCQWLVEIKSLGRSVKLYKTLN